MENALNKLDSAAKEISRQLAADATYFYLLPIVKCERAEISLRKVC